MESKKVKGSLALSPDALTSKLVPALRHRHLFRVLTQTPGRQETGEPPCPHVGLISPWDLPSLWTQLLPTCSQSLDQHKRRDLPRATSFLPGDRPSEAQVFPEAEEDSCENLTYSGDDEDTNAGPLSQAQRSGDRGRHTLDPLGLRLAAGKGCSGSLMSSRLRAAGLRGSGPPGRPRDVPAVPGTRPKRPLGFSSRPPLGPWELPSMPAHLVRSHGAEWKRLAAGRASGQLLPRDAALPKLLLRLSQGVTPTSSFSQSSQAEGPDKTRETSPCPQEGLGTKPAGTSQAWGRAPGS